MSKFDSMTDVEYFAAEDEFMDYYFAIGDIIGTEKDKTDSEETTPVMIKLKRPTD